MNLRQLLIKREKYMKKQLEDIDRILRLTDYKRRKKRKMMRIARKRKGRR